MNDREPITAPCRLCFQKSNVFINSSSAYVADPRQFADIQLLIFIGVIVIRSQTHRRGRVSRPVCCIKPKNQMDMIRHNNILVNGHGGIFFGDLPDRILCNPSAGFWDGKPVPYDVAEDFASVLGADGDEIGAVCAVVIF